MNLKNWMARITTCLGLCSVCLTAQAATITINDGGTHIFSAPTADWLDIFDGPGAQPTTVEIASGASLTGRFRAYDHTVVRVTGGSKTSQSLRLNQNATGEISGGYVQGVSLGSSATLQVTGGSINQLSAEHDTVVDIHKTTFRNVGIYAGVYLEDNAVISIYGSSFVLTDIADDVFPATWDKWSLTGFFADGTEFSTLVWYLKSDPGTLSLINVPEPTTLILSLLGAAALLIGHIRGQMDRSIFGNRRIGA